MLFNFRFHDTYTYIFTVRSFSSSVSCSLGIRLLLVVVSFGKFSMKISIQYYFDYEYALQYKLNTEHRHIRVYFLEAYSFHNFPNNNNFNWSMIIYSAISIEFLNEILCTANFENWLTSSTATATATAANHLALFVFNQIQQHGQSLNNKTMSIIFIKLAWQSTINTLRGEIIRNSSMRFADGKCRSFFFACCVQVFLIFI